MSGKEQAPERSIVIPVYNEVSILDSAIRDLILQLRGNAHDFELLVCENGSSDGSGAVLDALAEEFKELRAFHLAAADYGAALRHGILEAQGRFVICEEIDLCDLDFHNDAIALLSVDDADFVVGSKAARGAADHRPLTRRAATRVINGMLRIGLGFRGTDTHGLKAFHRSRVLPVVERCVVTKDLFASELVIRAQRMGLRITEIPIDIREKRPPSVRLLSRVPGVLKNLGQLIWVIRIQGERSQSSRPGSPRDAKSER